MLRNKIKYFINSILSEFNLKIENLDSVEPYTLDQNINPLSAQYFAGNKKILINIDLSKCRTNRWFDMSVNSLDPAIFAIRNSLKYNLNSNDLYKNILNILKESQYLVLEKNASEYLNIKSDLNEKITNYSWWAAVCPWDNLTFANKLKNYPFEVKENRKNNGMAVPVTVYEGLLGSNLLYI